MGTLLGVVYALLSCTAAWATISIPTQQIAPGINIPVISIGTWVSSHENASLIVSNWVSQGGRGIDTAYVYFDQKSVAQTLEQAGLSREDVFITSKVPGCLDVAKFIDDDLQQLNTSYIDLMLLHSAVPAFNCPNAWTVMEKYVQEGKLKSIGVSNFKSEVLGKLLAKASIKPSVNQISHSVLEHDDATVQFCSLNNVTVEAYSPLGSPGRSKSNVTVFNQPTITAIAKSHNVTNAQVALRWIVQRGHILTVLSESAEHQANDADVFGFELTEDEMSQLDQISKTVNL